MPLADNLTTFVYFSSLLFVFLSHVYLTSASNYMEAVEESTEANERSTLAFKGSTIAGYWSKAFNRLTAGLSTVAGECSKWLSIC